MQKRFLLADLVHTLGGSVPDLRITRCDAARTLQHAAHRRIVDRGTQYHPLSAAIDNRRSAERHAGTGSIVLPAVGVGEHDLAGGG